MKKPFSILVGFFNFLVPFLFFDLSSGAQGLPAGPKDQIERSIANWNSMYGMNVKATGWKEDAMPVIRTDKDRTTTVDDITGVQNAWLPNGDISNPAGMTAEKVADDRSVAKEDISAWQKKIAAMIKIGLHRVRISWVKGSTAFSTICVTDDNSIVYDDMLSNFVMIAHHSKCFDYHIGWAWQSKYEDMTRGKIWANLSVKCDDAGNVIACLPDCGGDMSLGQASCVCVTKIVGNCCVMDYQWAWACGFKKLKFNFDVKGVKVGVEVEGYLGSSGSGNGACAECCPKVTNANANAHAVPTEHANYRVGDTSKPYPQKVTTTSSSTLTGEVVDIRVPNNIQPGDTITGSVISKSQSATLQGSVVEVQNNHSNLKDRLFKFVVPLGVSSIPLLIKDSKGNTLTSASIPVQTIPLPTDEHNNPISPDQFHLPQLPSPGNFEPINYCQPGQQLTINGFFDGNASNTTCSINNIPLEVIAESPRAAFVQIPDNLPAGTATLTISDGGVTKTTPIQVVTVGLSADKTTILKNSSANITCSVAGMGNLNLANNHFRVELSNGSPQTIAFQGENPAMFTRSLDASNVTSGNSVFSFQARGINTGSYTVTANLTSNTCESCWDAYLDCITKSKAEEQKCMADCKANNGGWFCMLACFAAARAREVACMKEYLQCLKEKFGY